MFLRKLIFYNFPEISVTVMKEGTRRILTSVRGPTYLCFPTVPTEFEPGMTENEIWPRPAVDSHLTWPILPFHQQSFATHEANR